MQVEQRTEEWFKRRLGKVTASRVSDVMMKPTTAGYQNYMSQLVCERLTGEVEESFTSAAMQHGTDTEPRARAMYELLSGNDVLEVGFVDHPEIGMSNARRKPNTSKPFLGPRRSAITCCKCNGKWPAPALIGAISCRSTRHFPMVWIATSPELIVTRH